MKNKPLLGIDYGSTNIGIALGVDGVVTPMRIISGKNDQGAIQEINRFVYENEIEKIVMGLPLNVEGKETKQSLKTRKFAKLLKILSKKPVEFQEEYGTSIEAMEDALASGVSQKRRASNDHLSAAIILKRYFEEKQPKK